MLSAQSKGEALPLSPADAFTLAEISEQVPLLDGPMHNLGSQEPKGFKFH